MAVSRAFSSGELAKEKKEGGYQIVRSTTRVCQQEENVMEEEGRAGLQAMKRSRIIPLKRGGEEKKAWPEPRTDCAPAGKARAERRGWEAGGERRSTKFPQGKSVEGGFLATSRRNDANQTCRSESLEAEGRE